MHTPHYLFPKPSLLTKTNAELHAYIAEYLPIAEGMTDGTDSNSEVRIDYAQDTVRQAQDILANRRAAKINVNAINEALKKTDGPQVIVAASGRSVRIIWEDGAEETTIIPDEIHHVVIDALASPNDVRPSGSTNKEFAVVRILITP